MAFPVGTLKHEKLRDIHTPHWLAELEAAVCSEAEANSKIDVHKGDVSAHHSKTTLFSELTDRWTLAQAHRGAEGKILVFKGPTTNPVEEDKPTSGAWEHIETIELIQNTSPPIIFSNISSDWKTLRLTIVSYTSGGTSDIQIRFNGDAGAHYNHQRLYVHGTGVTASSETSQTQGIIGHCAMENALSILDVLIHQFPSNYTTVLSKVVCNNTQLYFEGVRWNWPLRINSISMLNSEGLNFGAQSRFVLEGNKTS